MAVAASARIPVESWVVPASEVQIHEPPIGCGGFGQVFRGTWCGTEVAVKKVFTHSQADKDEVIESFKQEVAVLTALRHPNIVLFIGVIMDPDNLCIIMEYVHGGSLRKLLNDEDVKVTTAQKIRWAADTARALYYLHMKEIIHRDLKTPNLLVDDDQRIKVCDFGLARVQNKQMSAQKGTADFMAPEVVQSGSYSTKADMFSFGVVLFEIITREMADELPRTSGFLSVDVDIAGAKAMIGKLAPPALVDLCLACLNTDPDARPNVRQAMEILMSLERDEKDLQTSNSVHSTGIPALGSFTQSAKVNLGEQSANALWVTGFGSQYEVGFDHFVKASCTAFRMAPEVLESIRDLLVDSATNTVTQRSLSDFLQYFRPLPAAFKAAADMKQKPWFHGALDGLTAALRLKEAPVGTFLLRFNDQLPGSFAIAYVKEPGKISHVCVEKPENKGFTVDHKTFYTSIDDLLFKFRARLVRPLARQQHPHQPRQLSRFESL